MLFHSGECVVVTLSKRINWMALPPDKWRDGFGSKEDRADQGPQSEPDQPDCDCNQEQCHEKPWIIRDLVASGTPVGDELVEEE